MPQFCKNYRKLRKNKNKRQQRSSTKKAAIGS
jgi:hypothetical protein